MKLPVEGKKLTENNSKKYFVENSRGGHMPKIIFKF